MAYNDKPMKMYYQNINGQPTPVYYPQYWSEELNDWVISSEENQLPVSNHIMTESGRWIPQRGSDDGAAHTQVTGSIVELYHATTDNVAVTPGSTYKIVEDQFRDDIKEIRGVLRWAFSSAKNWRLTINYTRDGGGFQNVRTMQSIDFDSQEALIEPMPILTDKWNLEITNLSENEEVFQRGTIIGVR